MDSLTLHRPDDGRIAFETLVFLMYTDIITRDWVRLTQFPIIFRNSLYFLNLNFNYLESEKKTVEL